MSLKWSSSIINQSQNQKGFYWFHPWLYLFEMSRYLCTRHECVSDASDGSRQLARQAVSQPANQSVSTPSQNLQPLMLAHHQKYNPNYYKCIYKHTHIHTQTLILAHTHVHIYIETNREKSFESGLWLAGVAAKCQLMGMFVHRRLELNQIFVDMFCFSFCFSEQQLQ